MNKVINNTNEKEEWISINEELPPIYTRCWSCNEGDDDSVCMCVMNKHEQWFKFGSTERIFPTHWLQFQKPKAKEST